MNCCVRAKGVKMRVPPRWRRLIQGFHTQEPPLAYKHTCIYSRICIQISMQGFRNARELLQAMMLRSEEVGNTRKLKARQVVVPPLNVGTRTDILPPSGVCCVRIDYCK
jgi:hypothetical protein